MEFEKIKKIIAEVLNVDEDSITMESTFGDDLGALKMQYPSSSTLTPLIKAS